MKKSMIVLFGLLLAVGWTIGASAQKLPDKSLAEDLVTIDEIVEEQHSIDAESMDGQMGHSHSAPAPKKAPGAVSVPSVPDRSWT